ncbi:MAG: LysR family transcriptional regulator [Sphingomonadales bacterium]
MALSTDPIDFRSLSLRSLKAVLYVAKLQNISHAAKILGRSQTAITKAIGALEAMLTISLFDRGARGVAPTPAGAIIARRAATVAEEFRKAALALPLYRGQSDNSVETNPLFSMDIGLKRLIAFVALVDHEDLAKAASALGVSVSAVYASMREIEKYVDMPLFDRTPTRLRPREYAGVLAIHIKLALAEIRHALDDIASLQGVPQGHVVIGTLPFTRTMIVPKAINRLLGAHPQLLISARDGPYDDLEHALRCGDLDFIVGALRPHDRHTDLETELLFEDRLALIVRAGHPLTARHKLSLRDLHDWDWILPPRATPSRQIFDQVLAAHGLGETRHVIETSSLAMIRGLLLESNRIALLSEHQVYYETAHGQLSVLPISLSETYRPIGVTMRARATLSPAAVLFLEHIRAVANEIGPARPPKDAA